MRLPARYLFAAIDPMKGLARAVLPQRALASLESYYKTLQARRILFEPDRIYLRERIIPTLLARGTRSVLFVGVRRYTLPVLAQIENGGATVWTADNDPEAAVFGVKTRHAIADITATPPTLLDRHFDAIIMNGVFGYGVDHEESCRKAFIQLRGMLAEGGILVVGWNTDRCPALPPLAKGFRPASLAGLGGIAFKGSTHRYDFFQHG